MLLDEVDFYLKYRIGQLIMINIIYNQLSSKKFNDMIKFSWKKSWYIEEYENFLNVKKVCFNNLENNCFYINC